MQIKRPGKRSGIGFRGDHQLHLGHINMACSRQSLDVVKFAARKQALEDRIVSDLLRSYVRLVADLFQMLDSEVQPCMEKRTKGVG